MGDGTTPCQQMSTGKASNKILLEKREQNGKDGKLADEKLLSRQETPNSVQAEMEEDGEEEKEQGAEKRKGDQGGRGSTAFLRHWCSQW